MDFWCITKFKPTGEELIITLGYALFVFALVAPPNVLLSAGLTIENLFHRLLGSEELFFTAYHLRRTALLKALSFFIPLGYFITLRTFGNPEMGFLNAVGNVGLALSVAQVATASFYIYLEWYAHGKWTGHPGMQEMKKIAENISSSSFSTASTSSDELEFLRSHPSPEGVASSIDKEFRRMEKFVAFAGRGLTSSWSGRRIVVTPSWILFSHRTTFLPICQLLGHLGAVVVGTRCINNQIASLGEDEEQERADPMLGSGVVMATIRIADMDSGACMLSFDLPASELENFRLYLCCPLVYAQGVSLEPSIIQRFLEAFSAVVQENEPIEIPPSMELERCIGCLSNQTSVAIRRSCAGECGSCRCRPMWCEMCVGRWFASRLAQSHVPTSEWVASRVPCPTCRSLFCVRDVISLKRAQY
uniref:Transmembrane protein 129 n=2 Tax=Echinococcus granulosus TaxID=6210 RepID=A0A068WXJ8_ECHGR|nr:Transmembrane protein 129 [Echinococcus granulosus]